MDGATGLTSIVGRRDELSELGLIIAATREGMSGSVVLRGEAGVGKTTLLRAVVGDALDLQHLHLSGVQAERGFAFAGLQRLVGGHLLRGEADLPVPQRHAIDVAFGRSSGEPADPYLVGLAVLNMLAHAATGRPTLVTIDDAHLLDDESLVVLGFAARRLDAEGVAMMFAARSGTDLAPLDLLAVLEVTDLEPDDAVELLERVVGVRVDASVADRVVRATGGNPLALHDLGVGLTEAQLDGRERLPEPLTVGRRLEDHYADLVAGLPESTRKWLLLAAAASTGDLASVDAAAAAIGLPPDASAPAEETRIVSLRRGIEFRHPLVRSAIYGAASTSARHAAHLALADSMHERGDPDRRAVHLAAAAVGPDEAVAAELDAAADRARLRGGLAARADLLVQAAALTPDPRRAASRLLEAGEAALRAGAGRRSHAILDTVEVDELDPLAQARSRLLRAEVVSLSGEEGGSARISSESLAAVEMVGDLDPEFTQRALAHACLGAMLADRLMQGTTVTAIAEAARAAPAAADSVARRLVEAFATIALDGYRAAIPAIRRAIDALLDPATPDHVVLERHLLGITLCTVRLDHGTTRLLQRRVDRIARAAGALGTVDSLLYAMSMTETIFGRLDEADDLLAEGVQLHTVLARSSREFDIYRHPELAAWRGGDRAAIDELIRLTIEAGTWMGHGAVVAVADIGRMTLELSCGDYATAKTLGLGLVESDGFAMHTRVLPDLVEAAIRDGDTAVATDALDLLRERASASGAAFGLALLARTEALLAPGDAADAAFRLAIERFEGVAARGELARAHLLYGEWLRRRRRPSEAREELRIAHQQFTDMGAEGFAERSKVELGAAGGRAGRRTVGTGRELTTQERQIAVLAADGLTNAEIGSRLFISAQTVDYHLRKVYRKLDLGSRRQLRGRTF